MQGSPGVEGMEVEGVSTPGLHPVSSPHLPIGEMQVPLEGLAAWEEIHDRQWHPTTVAAVKELPGRGHCEMVHPEQGLARWVAFVDGSFVLPDRASGAKASWAFCGFPQGWPHQSLCWLSFWSSGTGFKSSAFPWIHVKVKQHWQT